MLKVKLEAPVEQPLRIIKKLYCPLHGEKFRYRCEVDECNNRFICSHLECFEQHFHNDGKCTFSHFNEASFQEKWQNAQIVVKDSEKILKQANQAKALVEQLKEAIHLILLDMQIYSKTCNSFENNLHTPLDETYFLQLNQIFEMDNRLKVGVNQLKKHLRVEKKTIRLFAMHQCLEMYLKNLIMDFVWERYEIVHSSDSPPLSCAKFHEKLTGKHGLLFIFLGQAKIVGSYFPSEYPSVAEKYRKDDQAIIFISDQKGKIMTFRADPDAEYHLSVSNRHEICHGSTSSRTDGIRTYHNNFETLLYTLPSKSFIEEEKNNKANSSMNIHRFFILETMPPKDLLSCESSEDEKNYPKIDGSQPVCP